MILAKSVKGHGLGPRFESRNATHQMKTMTVEDLRGFRDHLRIPISDAELDAAPHSPPYHRPAEDSAEMEYLRQRRRELGGFLPAQIGRASCRERV